MMCMGFTGVLAVSEDYVLHFLRISFCFPKSSGERVMSKGLAGFVSLQHNATIVCRRGTTMLLTYTCSIEDMILSSKQVR